MSLLLGVRRLVGALASCDVVAAWFAKALMGTLLIVARERGAKRTRGQSADKAAHSKELSIGTDRVCIPSYT
ncbi:MAG TPA: hypothetical protein VJU86_04280 [Pyrinomonadaceae bacterium]|nr:hypothetical protein [Pyrinomonadaceae bacterium]